MMTRFRFSGVAPTTDGELEDMILAHEGGVFTDHPNDHGGPTKWGLTIPVLSAVRGHPCTADDIRALSREEAAAIYVVVCIRPFDGLADPLRANAIDMGVNAGVTRAVILLQQLVGTDVDGRLGPRTRAAAATRDWSPLYVGFRLAFYENILRADESQRVFRNGWRHRALSFYGPPRLRRAPESLRPVFGFCGKAYLREAA